MGQKEASGQHRHMGSGQNAWAVREGRVKTRMKKFKTLGLGEEIQPEYLLYKYPFPFKSFTKQILSGEFKEEIITEQ